MARPRKGAPALYWLARERTWCLNLDGQRHRLGADRIAAEAARLRLLADGGAAASARGPGTPGRSRPGLTVAEALAVYWSHLQSHADRRTLHRARTAIDAANAAAGELPAAEFGPRALARVREQLLERRCLRRDVGAPICRRYVSHLTKTIATAWNWLAGQELVPGTQALALRTLPPLRRGQAREAPRVLPVEPAVLEATLPWLTPPVAAMAQVQALTGMRPGEVCRLRRELLSTSPAELLTPANAPAMRALVIDGVLVWLYAPDAHKTLAVGKPRVIAIGPRAQQVLLPLLDRPRGVPLFRPIEAGGRVRRQVRESYDSFSYCRSVAQSIERANRVFASAGLTPLPHWSPLQLRHLAATVSDEQADRDTTAAMLGHATPAMGAVYAERAIRRAAAHVARLG